MPWPNCPPLQTTNLHNELTHLVSLPPLYFLVCSNQYEWSCLWPLISKNPPQTHWPCTVPWPNWSCNPTHFTLVKQKFDITSRLTSQALFNALGSMLFLQDCLWPWTISGGSRSGSLFPFAEHTYLATTVAFITWADSSWLNLMQDCGIPDLSHLLLRVVTWASFSKYLHSRLLLINSLRLHTR